LHYNIFYLAKWGLSAEYLYSVPIHILRMYIEFYNKHVEDEERARNKGTNPPLPKKYTTVGDNLPRK